MDFKQWFFRLYDVRKDAPIDDDAGVVNVLTAGAPTEVSLVDRFGTALANPLTFSNGKVTFYTAKTVTSVDLSILTAAGDAKFVRAFSASEHRVLIDTDKREQTLVIPFAASTAETDTGFDLPVGLLVKDVHLVVTTAEASRTMHVGILASETGGDADGLLIGSSVATAGFVNAYGVVTDGVTIDHVVHTAGYGAFLKQGIAGADAVATVGGVQRRYHRTDGTAKSISYTGSASTASAAGYIVLEYSKLVAA